MEQAIMADGREHRDITTLKRRLGAGEIGRRKFLGLGTAAAVGLGRIDRVLAKQAAVAPAPPRIRRQVALGLRDGRWRRTTGSTSCTGVRGSRRGRSRATARS